MDFLILCKYRRHAKHYGKTFIVSFALFCFDLFFLNELFATISPLFVKQMCKKLSKL